MLSENQMVKVRNAIESMYQGTCNIIEHQKYTKPNGSTGFTDVIVLIKQPCRVSFKAITSTNQSESVATVTQVVKLFISPDFDIKPGSKIEVTQDGRTVAYKQSGLPAMYPTHQEIILQLFDNWG